MDRQSENAQPVHDAHVLARADNSAARFILNDGSSYSGFSFGAHVSISGECVFQTGASGKPLLILGLLNRRGLLSLSAAQSFSQQNALHFSITRIMQYFSTLDWPVKLLGAEKIALFRFSHLPRLSRGCTHAIHNPPTLWRFIEPFSSGMVGYIESLTDPSYKGQILVLSYPMIGNYGVPSTDAVDKYGLPSFLESKRIQIAGLIVLDYSHEYSHWNAVKSLSAWLKESGVPALFGVDTRAVIKRLRNHGVMLGKIVHRDEDAESLPFSDPNARHLVDEVSVKTPYVLGDGAKTVVVVDCGMKTNQLRCLLARGMKVKVVPWDFDFSSDLSWDGLFISNGPGDPTMCSATIGHLTRVISKFTANPASAKPVFGICLGNQLLGLAAGAKTFKLKFGNRGHNQPCVDSTTGRCHLTSQNHGFAIDPETLPSGWKQYFTNANDQTNEGILHESLPIFSVQFHPEARGGPCETEYLFDSFAAKIRGEKFEHPLTRIYKQPQSPHHYSKVLILGTRICAGGRK